MNGTVAWLAPEPIYKHCCMYQLSSGGKINLYLHAACNASPRRMEIQSNPCRFASSSRRRSMERLQDDTPHHSAAGRMDTYCSRMEGLQ